MNNITLAGLFITSPSAAFAELRERPRFLFPLIALVVATALVTGWYYSVVDFEWLKDHLFSGNKRMQAMPEADRARAMGMMSKKMMLSSGVIATAIGLPMVLAIQAAYCMLAGKITNVQKSFLHWFSLLSWSNIPVLAGVVASMVLLATQSSPVQINPSELQMLSLNELFFHLSPSEPGYSLFSALSLLSLWTWGLAIIGVQTWSNRSWAFSTIFVLLPFVVIYGIWAFFALQS
jgi:hypothetical protein